MADGTEPILRAGTQLSTASGRRGTVGALLGAGGQGEVYSVTLDGMQFALKWYHPHYVLIDTMLRDRLTHSVLRGPPTGDFLWPLDLVDIPGANSFGYVMPLRSPDCVSVRALIQAPPQRVEMSLTDRARLCLFIATDFLELHANGFCYQDINFGGFFFEPRSARPLICDNDNVNIDGGDASVLGAPKFMAPEVVRREMLPNTRTDLFSMGVLFFYILFGWHPLDGRREYETKILDNAANLKLYGTDPLFIFDPGNQANGPVEGFHDPIVARWRSLPAVLRRLFVRAFTVGLADPGARVLETEWKAALRSVIDAVVACAGCGYEQVIDYDRRADAAGHACAACLGELSLPNLLLIARRTIALSVGRTIDAGAFDPAQPDLELAAASVEANPRHPGVFGLKNMTANAWQVSLPDQGGEFAVPPGQTIRILPGATIRFGGAQGRIVEVRAAS